MTRIAVWRVAIAVALAASTAGLAHAAETVRVGVLAYGTLNWELDVVKAHRLDAAHGVDVQVRTLASEDATDVAMMAGDVDVIVSDFLWVSRLRTEGSDLTFVPFSTAVGALMVPAGSKIGGLKDLRGKRIGVAGGPYDKSWLLIQALARRDLHLDLADENQISYAAPPLLSQQAETGGIDAILTFWQYGARLEAEGFRRVIGADEAARRLAGTGDVAALGYVFHEAFADRHPEAIRGFLAAAADAKAMLRASDAEWDRLSREGTIRDEGAALAALRDGYRRGIPTRSVREEEADAAELYRILADLGGEKLVGAARVLAPGTYWAHAGGGS